MFLSKFVSVLLTTKPKEVWVGSNRIIKELELMEKERESESERERERKRERLY